MHNLPRRRVQISFDPELGRTRQEFEAECNINNIMRKYQKTGVLDHLIKYAPTYGDYDAIDFQTAMDTIKAGEEMFAELPSSVRKHFDNDPAAFMDFVQDPDNLDILREMGLAKPAPESPNEPDPVPTPAPGSDSPV